MIPPIPRWTLVASAVAGALLANGAILTATARPWPGAAVLAVGLVAAGALAWRMSYVGRLWLHRRTLEREARERQLQHLALPPVPPGCQRGAPGCEQTDCGCR